MSLSTYKVRNYFEKSMPNVGHSTCVAAEGDLSHSMMRGFSLRSKQRSYLCSSPAPYFFPSVYEKVIEGNEKKKNLTGEWCHCVSLSSAV